MSAGINPKGTNSNRLIPNKVKNPGIIPGFLLLNANNLFVWMVDYPVQKWQTQRGRKNDAKNIFRQYLSSW